MARILNDSLLGVDRTRCIKIPISLCEYSLRNNCYRQLAAFVYLKYFYGNRASYKDSLFILALALERTVKTARNHIKWLISNNWLGYDPITGVVHIRSFNRLYTTCDLQYKVSVEFDPTFLKTFKEYIFSAVVASKINNQRWAASRRRIMSRRNPSDGCPDFDYFGISLYKIANHLNKSQASMSMWFRSSSELGYLTIKAKYKWISDKPVEYYIYLKAFPEDYGKVSIFKGKVWKRLHNEIRPEILLTRRANYKKGKKIETSNVMN